MKIVIASLARQEKFFAMADDGWFPFEVKKKGEVAVNAGLRRLDVASWSLVGCLRVTLSLPCDRCGREVLWPVDDEFVYRIVAETSDSEVEGEVDDENAALWLITGPTLDLGDVFRERVFLALPEKVLCAEDCRGLCPSCGADLNQEPCRCR